MKQKSNITIFMVMFTASHIFCMEKEKQIQKITQVGETVFTTKNGNSRYKNLEFVLKSNLTTTNDIAYNATPPKLQYETLQQSIKGNDMVYLKLCLTYKFNPNRYHNQLSLLHYAVEKHRPEAITILSKYNPDLVPLNEQQQTPLDYAMAVQCEDCINELAKIIGEKINELVGHQKHCGLTKHILKQSTCEKSKTCCTVCVEELIKQLKKHNLYEAENKTATQPLFITDNPATTTENTAVTCSSDA